MRPYENTNCSIAHQVITADKILVILRGNETDILNTFNGFYNFGASASHRRSTNKSRSEKESSFSDFVHDNKSFLDFTTGCKTVATFTSSIDKIRKFFFNKYFHRHVEDWPKGKGIFPACNEYANEKMKEFLLTKETFCDPTKQNRAVDYLYSFADRVSAERPDNNFAESVIIDTFEKFNKDPKFAEKDTFSEKDVYEDVG